jgi:hypothetical protein
VLRRETIFLDKARVLTWASCFLKFTKKGHLIIDHQKIYPKSESKMDTKNHEKQKPLVLQRVNFCFQNTWQSKDCIFRITCVGSLIKKSLIFKRSFRKRTSLISFQQTRLWIDMIFEIWELIPKQGKDYRT